MRTILLPAVLITAVAASVIQPGPAAHASDTDGATLVSPTGAVLSIRSPKAADEPASRIRRDQVPKLHTEVNPGEEGAIELVTEISTSSDRVELTYTADGFGEGDVTVSAEGAIFLVGKSGLIEGGFLPPTASDAEGRAVPTHFEVDGSTITQVIDSSGPSAGPAVEARVSVNATLLAGVWKNRPGGYKYKNGDQWSTRLTTWGRLVWLGGAVGNTTVHVQGWREWVNGRGPTTATIHQQYDCHVTYGYNLFAAGAWWDFETARPSRINWFTRPDSCNWTTS